MTELCFWSEFGNQGLKPRSGARTMYTPNFCSECGAKLLRLRWHIWTSRRFCSKCARRLWKERLVPALMVTIVLLGSGYVTGRIQRPVPPPLTIERRSDSPLNDNDSVDTSSRQLPTESRQTEASTSLEEPVYLCGARTKKGTPCSRRVHAPVRCWQHKGMVSIIPVVPIK